MRFSLASSKVPTAQGTFRCRVVELRLAALDLLEFLLQALYEKGIVRDEARRRDLGAEVAFQRDN